jgi:aminoglycoside phosphotransferase (APT) family kinase protein
MQVLAFGPTIQTGSLTRAQVAARYAEKTGRDVSQVEFYYRFGLFKTAAVLQQIYYRWKMGLTKDERFRSLNVAVAAMARQALAARG